MSFEFNWPIWDEAFMEEIRKKIETSLNANPAPVPAIVDKWTVKEISFGTKAPTLKLEKIHELSERVASLQFYFSYEGDFKMVLRTKVQINKVYEAEHVPKYGVSLMSFKPTELPLILTVQNIVLDGRIKIDAFLPNISFKKLMKGEMIKPKTRILIHILQDPLKSFEVLTNIQKEIPIAKSFFDNLFNEKARDGISAAMSKPIDIEV